MRWSGLAVTIFLLATMTACNNRDAAGPEIGYGDVLAAAGSGDIADTLRLVNELREASMVFYFIEHRLQRYGNADFVLAEAFNEGDELHRFILVVSMSGSYELVTNIGLPPSVTGASAPMPADALVYRLPATTDLDRLFGEALQSVPTGVGGLDDVDDGDGHFLTQRAGGTMTKSVVYGTSFPPLDDEPDVPTDAPDSQRYAATAAVYAFWADALAAAPTPDEIISTTP